MSVLAEQIVPSADLIPEGLPVVAMREGGLIPLRDHAVGWRVMVLDADGHIDHLGLPHVPPHRGEVRWQVVGLVPCPWPEGSPDPALYSELLDGPT